MTDLTEWLGRAVDGFDGWAQQWGVVEQHSSTSIDEAVLSDALDELLERLQGNYPFFHPRYIGQMLKPPHPAAVIGYLAAMLHNPNNHALDGGEPTSVMEKELIPELAAMFHLPTETLGHLTSSGTIANLEALFIARELHPGKAIAYCADAHYTHSRMCHVLGVEGIAVPSDATGRMDVDALEALLAAGRIGTVVVTSGSTGLGMVDRIEDIVPIARQHGVRVHVDGAYGGFFSILAWAESDLVSVASFKAIAECDSVVVDPHKHGLQPYGCGAVLFRDPTVGRFYLHDSPYTYFTSAELHLGEISLECSRAGAAAAALWLTRKVVPWTMDGLGARLAAGQRAAQHWRGLLRQSASLALFQDADLDIVTFLPRRGSVAELSAAAHELFERAMNDPTDPVFIATYGVSADALLIRHPDRVRDADTGMILRSVLMKPENEANVAHLHRRLEELLVSQQGGDSGQN
jgi:glutamate/tyrosine decarboxylase-like PLP-dependent enzyme